ncbi:M24 family metallopeptidase [Amycolatopsis saalfeldensis]|uniref:Creatinase/Prolidase N-terminal domain-containing protein n=1 Tax=Amycolatopsis saalfeldensis TaxID=394193 RepID=A0A1H8XE28_9PSEU|nr:Xaa-Pro peptidase family protein [Amycolatopsis saalfeldensis]SEP37977.1 Creatinase/Prolidase N-terminal domain-containing protein [Amycolatopsis saalfeldensis]
MTIDHAPAPAGAGLSPEDQAELRLRHRKIRDAMAEQGLDVVLAYGPAWRRENIRYFTDVTPAGSAALVVFPAEGDAVAFSTRPSDLAAFTAQGWVGEARRLDPANPAELGVVLKELAPRRLGIAHHELVPLVLMETIRAAASDAEVGSATKLLDTARLVKSEWELARMRRSAVVCAAGWEAFVDVLKPGLPEYRIVAEVEARLKNLGAEDNFMLIASGRDEVRGMTPPGDRRLEAGDLVRTELTPKMDGYWLQICRSAVVGKADDGQRKSFDLFNEAVEAGISVVRPGVTAHEVAVAENDVFRKHGYGEYCTSDYTRVRGHGHGLHLDETPIIEGNHTVLPENSVFIIHPNTYTPLAGYHVLGDPVRVTADGCEVLITTERKLFETGGVA